MSASSTAISLRKMLGDERVPVFSELADEILNYGAYKATKYLSDKLTIKATRKKVKLFTKAEENRHPIEIVFTVGKPNYEERAHIKRAKKLNQGPIEMTLKYAGKKK